MACFAQQQVGLVLCGHLHVSHCEVVPNEDGQLIVAIAGTATSTRGRKDFKKQNTYNRISITGSTVEIDERSYDPRGDVFQPHKNTRFSSGCLVSEARLNPASATVSPHDYK